MNTPLKYNPKTESLVLRACHADLTSRKGFSWKNKHVKAPNWSPAPTCGRGLHGWLNGQGDPDVWTHRDDDKWLILAVKTSTVVDLGGKVKFPAARTLYVGTKAETVSLLVSTLPGVPVMFANLTGDYGSTLTGGNYSTLTGGDDSTLTGGNRSTLTGGSYSTLTGGSGSTLTGDYGSTLTGGNYSTLTGGDHSTLTGGNYSTLTGGNYSTLTGGSDSTLTGGNCSTLQIKWWDNLASRWRIATAYVGEDGIEANTAYKLDDNHQFIKA